MRKIVSACLLSTALGAPAWSHTLVQDASSGQTTSTGAESAAPTPATADRSAEVATPTSAAAQPTTVQSETAATSTGDEVPGDIIVTAQKRSERLTDVPISITAATGEQLANAGVVSAADLVKVVPGFTYRPSDYGTPIFYLRGVGFNDIAVAVAPAVSVYVDQTPVPYLAMAQGVAFDVERVEVLKGPQGTLFGQNSTGGAINFIAARPTSELRSGVEFTYGRYDQIDVQGFVSGPLSDTVRGRLAVRHEGRDGWQISQTRPDDRLGVRDFTNARLLLDWDASDALRFQFNANGWKDRSDTLASQFVALAIQSPPPFGATDTPALIAQRYPDSASRNPRIADWGSERPTPLPPYIGQSELNDFRRDDSLFQFSLRGDLDLSDAITLTSITAYSQFKQDAPIDPDGTAISDFGVFLRGSIKSFSQELRVTGVSGPLSWMIGSNYARDRTVDDQQGDYYGSNTNVGGVRYSTFINSNRQKIRTAAVFGSLDYEITPDLTARGSARYTDYRNEFNGCLRDSGDGQLTNAFAPFLARPGSLGGCVTIDPATFTAVDNVNRVLAEDNVSWRAGLDWKPTADSLLYANVTRGYKAGSFPTVPGLVPDQFRPVGQERVTAYEAGFKLDTADRRLQLTGAGFYYSYNDKQIIGYITAPAFGNVPALVQIPKSTIKGFELSLVARPTTSLTLNGGATYVHSRVDSSFLTNDPFAVVVDVRGEQLPITPEWQLNGDVDYRRELTNAFGLAVGGNVRYQSSSPAAFGDAPGFRIPGYAIVDLRAGIEANDGRWRAQLWGRNIFNKFYINSITHVTDTVARTVGIGATYGATVGHRF